MSEPKSNLVQNNLKLLTEAMIAVEELDYHNSLKPFALRKEEIKLKIDEFFSTMSGQIKRAKKLIQEAFEEEEKRDLAIPVEARYSRWAEIAEKMEKKAVEPNFSSSDLLFTQTLQEAFSIPWPFLDRVFALARAAFKEGSYQKAEDLYHFLTFLHPAVFEYWFEEAICQQVQKKYKEAFDNYSISLLIQPKNPQVFFQMACCLYGLQEKSSCSNALDICIEYAQLDDLYSKLVTQAEEFKLRLAV